MTLSLKTFPKISIIKKETNLTIQPLKGLKVARNSIIVPTINSSMSNIKSRSKKNAHVLEILFHGLNLSGKRKRLRRLAYQIDVHKSELFLCSQSRASEYKSRTFKRRLLLISNKPQILDTVGRFIQKFKLPNIYTGKGLFFRDQKYIVKKGKEYKK